MSSFIPSPTVGLSGSSDGNGMTSSGGCGNVGNSGSSFTKDRGKEEGGCYKFVGQWFLGDGRSSRPVFFLGLDRVIYMYEIVR